MKITVDVDITPEELRRFLGLPNVEKLQEEMMKQAQAYLAESPQSQYRDLITTAFQPLMAYQKWLQRMVQPDDAGDDASAKTQKKTPPKSGDPK